MVEEIFHIDELPATKRRKLWAAAQAQLEQPLPVTWLGLLIPHAVQIQFLTLISDGGKKVAEVSLENMKKNRKDHEWRSVSNDKKRHSRRISQPKIGQNSFSHRKVDKIDQSM